MPNKSCYIQFATLYSSLLNREYQARQVEVNLHFSVSYFFISKYNTINEINLICITVFNFVFFYQRMYRYSYAHEFPV